MIKFAIPLASGKLTAHFGHCQEFALMKLLKMKLQTNKLAPPPHEQGVLPITSSSKTYLNLDYHPRNPVINICGALFKSPSRRT